MVIYNPYNKELADTYNSEYRFDHPHQLMAYLTWLEEIGNIEGFKILDLSCGSGISTRMLSDRGAIVTGVDISESMIHIAKHEEEIKPVGNKYILADTSIPKLYTGGSFDMVTAAFLLHYASTLEILENMIKNIALNMKKGSKFLAINMSPEHPIVLPRENISHSSGWVGERFEDGSEVDVVLWTIGGKQICTLQEYYWSKETLERCMKSVGLENIKWIELRMHDKGKKLKNWKEMEKKNMLVVIEATKI